MKPEKANKCLRDAVDYEDKKTGLHLAFTAEDCLARLAVVNADIVSGEEVVGNVILQLDFEADALQIAMANLRDDLTGAGFGRRWTAHIEKVSKKAGASFLYINGSSEAAERTVKAAGWVGSVTGLDIEHQMGKAL